ncbi:MAG: EAL domain-containing protein [Candidatus Marinarcus sp.]|uniref:EAL domain-containing protein n=1 Tax=Candidatus Marinarcus sp. TaxID=3100987 RepID=UPI003B007854
MKINLTYNVKLLLLEVLFIALIAGIFFYNYDKKVKQTRAEFFTQLNSKMEFVLGNLESKILTNSYETTSDVLKGVLNTLNLNKIQIRYKTLFFSKESLIKNSSYPQYLDWSASDITTDVKNGYVLLQNNNMYQFFNTTSVDLQKSIKFKFLLSKNRSILNTSSDLNFYYAVEKDINVSQNKEQNRFKRDLYFLGQPFASCEYSVDVQPLLESLDSIQQQYLKGLIYTLLTVIFFTLLIYLVFIKKMLLDPIVSFKKSMNDALENNFMHKIDKKVGQKDVDDAFVLLNKILHKYIGVVNELNINKGILERKVFTDDLTGLPNQKVFELDLKNMFIVGADGFVGSIKLESLGNFTKEFGSALANHLIEEFTHVVQNKFYEMNLIEATLYRFFGSEFAIILKNEKEPELLEFAQSLKTELEELALRYEIKSDLAYFSFVPFDKYGTIDSILHASSDAYAIAKTKEKIYHIVSPSEVLDKFQFLEENVREIIQSNSYEVTYGFETRTLNESHTVIMKEAMPILYDKNKEKFSIGVFISVAEKINMAVQFDKGIIETVVKFIQSNAIDYHIAINLSMFSLKDKEFINWLHSLFLYHQDVSKYLVFSMTSYNASTNVEVFKEFINEIHRFGSKIILKRFSSNDFSIDQLEELNLDYLRINKDYTTTISKDRDKKHFLRTVINFGQSNDIIVIGDSIKDEKDIEICSSIGLDAISNY